MSNEALFALPEPPDDDENAMLLFVDRERELDQAAAQVDAVRRSHIRRPMAIVGQARVGKSHLLKQLEMRIRADFDVAVWIRVSTGLSDSRALLRETLNQVHVAVHNAAGKRGLGSPENPGVLEALERILADYSEAIAGSAAEVELTRVREVTRTVGRSSKLTGKLPGLLARLGALELGAELEAKREHTARDSSDRTVKVNPFEENTLVDLIGMAHALVQEHRSDWTTLIILDDFDLLKRAADGSLDPDPLLQALSNLARMEGLYVLTTVREDTYYRHDKTFHRIAYIAPFDEAEPLKEVYRRHVEQYMDGVDPFGGRFVDEAADRCEGRIGVFLTVLREAFMVTGVNLSRLNLADWMLSQWDDMSQRDPLTAAAFRRAVREGGGYIHPDDMPAVRRSALMRFALEDYTSSDSLRIEPIMLSILRSQTEARRS